MSLQFLSQTTTQVSIKPVQRVQRPWWVILIMGPTGSGKSTFIEALAGNGRSLGISKDQLAGYTQHVACYELTNADLEYSEDDGQDWKIYFLDTPGFSDGKISEMEIITHVKTWMLDNLTGYFNNILYLWPITDPRVSGSKHRTIKMLQSLLRKDSASSVTIVTTMWDRVSTSPQAQERAEARFAQLRDDIWKDVVNQGSQIVRFRNTHDSAVDIIKACAAVQVHHGAYPLDLVKTKPEDPSAQWLYRELLERITHAQQAKEALRQDHLHLITNPDPLLEPIITPRLQDIQKDLSHFLEQLVAFGQPPPGFEEIPQQIAFQHLIYAVNEALEDQQVLRSALAAHQMDHHQEREATLSAQLRQTELKLADRLKSLVEYGKPPPGFEKALESALALARPTLALLPVSVAHHTPFHMTVDDASSSLTPAHASYDTVIPKSSCNTDPACSHLACSDLTCSATPEGRSISSLSSFKGRVKQGVRSVQDKLTFRSKREHHG